MHAIEFLKQRGLYDVFLNGPDSSPNIRTSEALHMYTEHLQREIIDQRVLVEHLMTAIVETITENLELADGDNCTLIKLKRALSFSVKTRM